jgi:hypothetical protein
MVKDLFTMKKVKMTKEEVQKRVSHFGKPFDTFEWDGEKFVAVYLTNAIGNLVIDFCCIEGVSFEVGSGCALVASSNSKFEAGSDSSIITGGNCSFKLDSKCSVIATDNCIFETGDGCIINVRDNCTFVKLGNNCMVNAGSHCKFDNVGSNCFIKTKDECEVSFASSSILKIGENCKVRVHHDCTLETGFNTEIKTTGFENIAILPWRKKIIQLERETIIKTEKNEKGFVTLKKNLSTSE